MKDSFFQIIFESPPAEVELSTELRCREIMKSNDIDAFDITGGRLVYSRTNSKAAITKKSFLVFQQMLFFQK